VLAFFEFSVCRRSSLSFLWIERCFCPPTLLLRVTSGLFEHRSEAMEAFEVVGQWSAGTQSRRSGGSSGVSRSMFTKRVAMSHLKHFLGQSPGPSRKCRRHFRLAACRERPVAQHPKIFSYEGTPVAKSDRLLAACRARSLSGVPMKQDLLQEISFGWRGSASTGSLSSAPRCQTRTFLRFAAATRRI